MNILMVITPNGTSLFLTEKTRPEGVKPLGILIKEKGVYHTACECGDSNAGGPGCISPS
jgi:hypothetical protein